MDIKEIVKKGDIEKLKELIEKGTDLNKQYKYGVTVLNYLSNKINRKEFGNEMFELLLKNGADPNIPDNYGWTPLMTASGVTNILSNIDTVKLLLKYGADINKQNIYGRTALLHAVKNLNEKRSTIETVKLLLENGANPFIKNKDNEYPIDSCSSEECKYLISEYMWKSIDKNIKKLTISYSKSGDFKLPKDIWKLILLRDKQRELCKNLSSDKNKEILYCFALSLDLPINKNMNKSKLCGLISKQLVWGNYYNSNIRRNVYDIANVLGIDINQPIEKILDEINMIFNLK